MTRNGSRAMPNYGSEDGTSFAAFDPSLGTLNSVSSSIKLTSTLIQPEVAAEAANLLVLVIGAGAEWGSLLRTGHGNTAHHLQRVATAFGTSFNKFAGPGSLQSDIELQVDAPQRS
jgi:hypothetical protein